ncbi:uncharacterized protein LOC144865188 [Branchiostoma floridae x Branchiostoma japonicum]
MTNVVINSAGYVTWMAPRVFRSSCNIDIYFFPFDDQKCLLEFGSWTYGGYDVNTTTESVPPSLTYFVHNDEWELLAIGDKHEDIYYVCCPEPYPLVTFTIYVRRRSMYYLIFLVSPCLLFSIMTILGFYLPPEAGERVGLGITVLLAFTVFLLMVSELMPPTSSAVPLIVCYYGVTIMLVMFATFMTILILNFVCLFVCLFVYSVLLRRDHHVGDVRHVHHHPDPEPCLFVCLFVCLFTVCYYGVTIMLVMFATFMTILILNLVLCYYGVTIMLVMFATFMTILILNLVLCYYGVTIMLVMFATFMTILILNLALCYYGVTIMLVMFATFMTILILNLHHTDPSCRPVPPWVRRTFLHGLGRVFCTRPHHTAAPPTTSLSNCTELEFLCEEYETEIRVTDNGKNKNGEDAHAPEKCPERYLALLRALRMLMRELHHHVMKCQQLSAANESRDNDWKRVARVLDKLCVALFTFTTVVTAVAVLLKVPHINL